MARCGRCNEEFSGCLCSLEDTDCIIWSGSGNTPNSLVPIPVIDPDPDNLLSCGPAGFFAPLPDEITNPPTCRVHTTGNLSVPDGSTDGSTLTVTYGAVRWDIGGFFDFANPTLLTIPIDGLYLIIFLAQFAANATGLRMGWIVAGDILILGETRVPASPATGPTAFPVTSIWKMRAGEVITTKVLQSSGGALNLESVDAISAELMIVRVAPYPEN